MLLTVENLQVAFGRGEQQKTVVKGVDFSIKAGETVALVGESGSGKSLTALSLLRLLSYPTAWHPSGKVIFEGKDIMWFPGPELRALRGSRISMVFQDPFSSLNPVHPVGQQIAESIELHQKIDMDTLRTRVQELLALVGLSPDKEHAYPHELSGGERQRIMIAMAIANKPDLLIADEPTSSLDVSTHLQISDLLKTLKKKFGMALLLITHDLYWARDLAERVLVMHEGRIIEQGTVQQILSNPKNPYTHKLIYENSSLLPVPLAKNPRPILEVQDLRVAYDQKGILEQVSFTIGRGETMGLVGESGSGKTTLALAILRLIPSQGQISFMQEPIDQVSSAALRPLRKDLQIVFQDPYSSLNPRLTVQDIIGEGLQVHKLSVTPEKQLRRIKRALSDVGLSEELLDRYPYQLSGGQAQRVAIARSLILKPQLLILDEPISSLDITAQGQILTILHQLQQRYKTSFLFISHDLRAVRCLSHHVMVMKEGQVVEQGPTVQVFKSPKHFYTKTLLAAASKAIDNPQ
jgi:microcin C transport system ATP-binding protein